MRNSLAAGGGYYDSDAGSNGTDITPVQRMRSDDDYPFQFAKRRKLAEGRFYPQGS